MRHLTSRTCAMTPAYYDGRNMKRNIAVEWAEMLLSNPDAQGVGGLLLQHDGRMCALGVLTWMLDGDLREDSPPWTLGGVRPKSYPDDEVLEAAGAGKSLVRIAGLNDLGYGFKELAFDIIKNSEKL